ncbi:MAG TPA: amidase family protein [Candidatus Acidoferrum sp.]|jgi:Asp-tRNA(Asn)/Glu-tRNA(Gln) amidotransferase A subunit family amidase|nr:amidase family protein [Candidatus Acidoferrum sp.]
MVGPKRAFFLLAVTLAATEAACAQQANFHLEEATIDDVQRAIRDGRITCKGLIQLYINRAKAYNGVSNVLVTKDGEAVPPASGVVRAGTPLKFPTQTIAISSLLPDFEQYAGPPIEFGRMESTASDPTVQQQFGMIVGIPHAGQLNALGTINIRGERSVTCKGDRDRRPSDGPLPPGSPAVCEEFRKQPDALEHAAELDAQYGRNPDLAKMPMYCIAFSFKDAFDTKDMRSTGGGDAHYDIDFPARDQTLVAQLREKGAIIYAKTANTEYNGRPVPSTRGGAGAERGTNRPAKVFVSVQGYQRSTWAGNPSDVYDTTRAASLGSSSGSGVSVSANLATCSICEETSLSCRGPSNHNAVALILPHKSLISFLGGAIGADIYLDRTGIMCRTVKDAAKVLDALKDPANGYYDPRDIFTTVPRSSVLDKPYVGSVASLGTRGSLRGMRIGIVRESMLTFPGTMADEPISQAAAKEIKTILGDYLGATLVESVDPLWPDDPSIENMSPSYTQALAQLVPIFFPDILYRLKRDGQPQFPEFAAKIKPTEFAPGKTLGTGAMKPIDYFLNLAEGRVPVPKNLNIRAIEEVVESNAFTLEFNQYALRRAADWKERGFIETMIDFPTLNARSKFWGDDQRAAFKNWEEMDDMRNTLGDRQGIDEHIMMRELLRRVEMKVISENHLDAVVRLHYSLPPGKIGLAPQPEPPDDTRGELRMGPFAGVTEVLIPAGYVRTVYDPVFVLSADKKRYVPTNNNTPTTLPRPGLPFSLVFRAEPGKEDVILKIASAYEAASKRRIPPPEFGPLPGEP